MKQSYLCSKSWHSLTVEVNGSAWIISATRTESSNSSPLCVIDKSRFQIHSSPTKITCQTTKCLNSCTTRTMKTSSVEVAYSTTCRTTGVWMKRRVTLSTRITLVMKTFQLSKRRPQGYQELVYSSTTSIQLHRIARHLLLPKILARLMSWWTWSSCKDSNCARRNRKLSNSDLPRSPLTWTRMMWRRQCRAL